MKEFFMTHWLAWGMVLPMTLLLPIFSGKLGAGGDFGALVELPKPNLDGKVSVEAAVQRRRSVREYAGQPLTLAEVAQLLWAAQGVAGGGRLRTAPSAGALYPLELYVVAGNVAHLPAGVYRYLPHEHRLLRIVEGDKRSELAAAALGQSWVRSGAAVLVFTAVFERTTRKYGQRGIQYVHMEVGHAAQNVCLQAVALDLGSVVVGAFRDRQVQQVLQLPEQEQPLYIMPLGKRSY